MRDEAPIDGRGELEKRPALHSRLTILEIVIVDVRYYITPVQLFLIVLVGGVPTCHRYILGWVAEVGWEQSGGYARLC